MGKSKLSSKNFKKRSISANHLRKRIEAYKGRQTLNLNEWIFGEVVVPPGATVLELCSGTGVQTEYLVRQVGPGGKVYALDISEEALQKTVKRCDNLGGQVVALQGELDGLENVLRETNLAKEKVDMCFCAYGLYYAEDVLKLLDVIKRYLVSSGELVVVGPYGKNNEELFALLREADVDIPEYVTYTSQDFMPSMLLPKMTNDFSRILVRTAQNAVTWKSSEEVLSYWRNTTFYDQKRESKVAGLLEAHFKEQESFVNYKHIMCAAAA